MSRKFQFGLFLVSIFVYLFFYISAYFTHTLDPFFAHATIGQDFFQIPNGAYAFLHGGTLTGYLPKGAAPYIDCCGVNHNVYHPLFTLLVGIPLQVLPPWTAMIVWAFVHIMVMAILVCFLWRRFHKHKYIYFALSLLLLNANNYYEIWLTQYQFLVNFFTILFLYESIEHGDTGKAGLWLFFSLLVKPIGLLWIIPLLFYKRFKTVIIGFGVFLLVTGVFAVFPFTFGQYYITNFIAVSRAIIPTHNIYSIIYLIPSFPLMDLKLLSIVIAVGLLVFQISKKPPLFTVIALWTGYQLIFYPLVYHYQYTILAGVFCLGILFTFLSLKIIPLLPVIFLTLPAPVIFLHLFGDTSNISHTHAAFIWLYEIFLLICFLVGAIVAQNHKIIPKSKE